MASVAVLYLDKDEKWDYKAKRPLQELIDIGVATSIYDPYDAALGNARRYFCCRCGYPCYRSPSDGRMFNVAGDSAFFAHYSIPNHPYCKFRTEKSDGLSSTLEKIGNQVIEDDYKTTVVSWCSLPLENALLDGGENRHQGTVEDDLGPPAENPTMRHMGLKELREREIHSVQYIAYFLHDFLDRDIKLPGCDTYSLFRDVFFHASQTADIELNASALFWGQVQKIFHIREHFWIAFGYATHCLYFAIPEGNFHKRKWSINSISGKYIIVAGQLKETQLLQAKENARFHSRPCRRVLAPEWGASGIVGNNEIKFLPYFDEVEWVEPAYFRDEIPSFVEGKSSQLPKDVDDIEPSLESANAPSTSVTEQEASSSSTDTKVPEVFTDAQLARSRERRLARMQPLTRLVQKIKKKMHN